MRRKKTTVVPSIDGGSRDDGDLFQMNDVRLQRDYFPAAAAGCAAPDVFWKLYVPPNFLLNRSTRPAVSTNFCLPVKNGWQAAQISTAIRDRVLRVVNVLPQAQWTLQTWYFGWVFSFMGAPFPRDVRGTNG